MDFWQKTVPPFCQEAREISKSKWKSRFNTIDNNNSQISHPSRLLPPSLCAIPFNIFLYSNYTWVCVDLHSLSFYRLRERTRFACVKYFFQRAKKSRKENNPPSVFLDIGTKSTVKWNSEFFISLKLLFILMVLKWVGLSLTKWKSFVICSWL